MAEERKGAEAGIRDFQRGDQVRYDGEIWTVTGCRDARHPGQVNLKRRGVDGRISFAVAETSEVEHEEAIR